MYLYNGDEENAYKNACLAYDFHLRWFRWTGSSYQGGVSNINFLYPKRYNELFLCFSNNDVVDNVENILKGYSSALRMKNMDILFAGIWMTIVTRVSTTRRLSHTGSTVCHVVEVFRGNV